MFQGALVPLTRILETTIHSRIFNSMVWNLFKSEFKKANLGDNDPTFKRIRAHAKQRLNLSEIEESKERLFACKEYLRIEVEMLWRQHREGESGLKIVNDQSVIIDSLIERLFNYAVELYLKNNHRKSVEVSTLALGGFGRSELCPRSDIDIMFLLPQRMSTKTVHALQQTLTQEVLYPLWDLGLKVGYSTRNIKEAIEEARGSVESKNAMLEARCICGSQSLFERFYEKYRDFYLADSPQEYAKKRLFDQRERRKKYGNTVFMQQPNIKNGVGGLRDYQNILWVSFVRLNSNSLEAIEAKGYLNKDEVIKLRDAYDFLLRVRNELHFHSQRATDVLDLESQPEIAWGLGYKQHDIFKRVEAFMHDYFRSANNIFNISNLLERRLATSDMPDKSPISMSSVIQSRQHIKREVLDGFILEGHQLSPEAKDVFKKDPTRLIRVFRHAQQRSCEISLDLLVLIRESVPLIDARVIASEAANRSFRAILQTLGNVAPTLYLMHECGVLGRFMPEFGRLTCQVQHEYYHLYTADIHILRTLEELDTIFSENQPNTQKYKEALRKTRIPGLLYLMLLLHDLGKAEGIKGHAEAGLSITLPILKRMRIPEEHYEQILFIIKNHFEMARFTLNYDIDDPATANTFAKSVDTPENLHYLYVHTYCDARGTSHDLWNGYKDSILTRLYERTLDQFKGEAHVNEKREREKAIMKDKLLSRPIEGISKEEVEAHFNLLPDRYFINHTEEEIEQHLKMINRLLAKISDAQSVGSLEPVVEWHDDTDQGLSVVHIVTWDRAGLFYKLAGAFTLANLSILSSKIITREDHITIDTFFLTDAKGGIVKSKTIQELFQKTMRDSLLHGKDLTADIIRKAEKEHNSLFSPQTERLRTNIPPVVDIYHELSLKRTIVEIQATDYIGLLYEISKSIFDHGFDINFARISTQRDAALDVFYIENINRDEPIATSRLIQLRNSLEAIIADPATTQQAQAS